MTDKEKIQQIHSDIQSALHGKTGIIESLTEENEQDVFYMLMFCLCVPQSRAVKADEAIKQLRDRRFYDAPIPTDELSRILQGLVRFHVNKAGYLANARLSWTFRSYYSYLLSNYNCYKKTYPSYRYSFLCNIRDDIIKEFIGMGMKVASHFMRNIGLRGLCIVDRHILTGMVKRGLIPANTTAGNRSQYLAIEKIFLDYAMSQGVNSDELDLLFWSEATGYVFK